MLKNSNLVSSITGDTWLTFRNLTTFSIKVFNCHLHTTLSGASIFVMVSVQKQTFEKKTFDKHRSAFRKVIFRFNFAIFAFLEGLRKKKLSKKMKIFTTSYEMTHQQVFQA